MVRQRQVFFWGAALIAAMAACGDDAAVADGGVITDGTLSDHAPITRDGVGDHTRTDTAAPCASSGPAKPDWIERCRLRHDPTDSSHLSARRPGATEAVTVAVLAKAGDVKTVTLRYYQGLDGVATSMAMKLAGRGAQDDRFVATLPPAATPIYYRFIMTDGKASVTLNRSGASTSAPVAADEFFISPNVGGKTLRYRTTFSAPEVWVKSAGGVYRKHAMVKGPDGLFSATSLAPLGRAMEFYFADARSAGSDRPPGGGDYYLEAKVDQAWVQKGVVFDVDPARLKLGPLDCHTHPYDRVGGKFVYDPTPLRTLAPAQGIRYALTMLPGSTAAQKSALVKLHRGERWIRPLVWVDPRSHTVAAVEDLLKSDGFLGLKFHPSVSGYPADGAAMDAFLVLARKLRVPVSIHSATDDKAKPARIIALAKRHPAVPIIMVHTELGSIDKTAVLAAIKGVPNIYAETSWTNPKSILQAFSTLDSSRVLFGTDGTVDGMQHFSKKSIANPAGQYVYTVAATMAQVKAQAHADAYANWAYLNAIRLFRWRFAPDADRYDTDGDGLADNGPDPDDDNDGKPDSSDPYPRDPAR